MASPAFDMAEYNTPAFTRYISVHEQPQGAGDARPTALQIVKDNDLEGTQATSIGFSLEYTNLVQANGRIRQC